MDTPNIHQTSDSEHPQNAPELRDTWSKPQGAHLPRPTYMPVVLALGFVCMLWGIVTTYLITLVGVALFAVAILGWIGELRHEHRDS